MKFIEIEKLIWLAIAFYWFISSFSVKRSLKKQAGWQRGAYILCMYLAFSLLFQDYWNFSILSRPLLPQNGYWKMAGLIICTAGLIFALSARIYLGSNWSGRITIKENHELIQTGPYGITRNPIYTGFLTAFLGTSMSLGLVKGYLGILLFVACLLLKISKEEEFMQEVFGEKFKNYQANVKRLIPLLY
jgi:protein-S-isoprenylcysteine O-methyltransferase Ste14